MDPKDLDTLRSVDELRAYRAEIDARTAELDKEFDGKPFSDEASAEFESLKATREEVKARIDELEARAAYLNSIAGQEDSMERVGVDPRPRVATSRLPENVYALDEYRQRARSDADYTSLVIDGARKAVEASSFPHPNADEDKVKAQVSSLFATIDDPQALARHILRTGSPAYGAAFGKTIGALSTNVLSQPELGALSLGTDSAGGFAVPFQLDPTIIATSDGAINPLRRLSRVERITGKKWYGVSSTGVTVSRAAEGAQVADGSPTLSQPEVEAIRVHGFVPFSIELGLAWGALQTEIARLLQDAKDEEEADSFINGDGTGTNPNGLVATLASASVVVTGDTSFGVEDIYATKNALPPRHRPRAQWLAEGGIYDEVRQLDTAGGADLWVQLADPNPARLIGYPANEMSSMDGTVADTNDILLIGNFSRFLIVDRIGMTVELIPHLFQQTTAGTGVGLPTGQRGIYAHWHNNCEILDDNAFRLLRVGADLS